MLLSIQLSAKRNNPIAVSANPTKEKAKPNVAAGTNDLSPNNEKRAIPAQRNLLKREQSKPEHNSPNRYIEVGMNSLHRIPESYIPVNRGSKHFPAAADPPKGSGEVLERDRGSKSPVSFQPPPRGVNKIYNSDTVFPIGEARKKVPKPNAASLYASARSR